jgi:hypothetical protein
MGEWFELRWLGGEPYVDYQSEQSKWASAAVKLDADEVQAIEDFQIKQANAEKDFIKQLLGGKLNT